MQEEGFEKKCKYQTRKNGITLNNKKKTSEKCLQLLIEWKNLETLSPKQARMKKTEMKRK